jgi:hypothetical protein
LGATVSQCVSVQANTTYHFSYRFKAAGDQTAAGTATCIVHLFWSGNNCVIGQQASSTDFYESYSGNSWIQASGTVTTNALTTQAMIHCSSPASNGYHDHFYFGSDSPGNPGF